MNMQVTEGRVILTPRSFLKLALTEGTCRQFTDKAGSGTLEIDMRETDFFSAFGVSMLIRLQAIMAKQGGRLVLSNVGEFAREMLRACQCEGKFDILDCDPCVVV